jgi:PPOX class probable FMN-dependent enzyme
MDDRGVAVRTAAELEEIVGTPIPRVAEKVRERLHDLDREWIGASPRVFIATRGADGGVDVSPKGDPAGFVRVLDERTVAIPERPGNRRADGFHNLLADPHIGLIFVIPGRGDTLRVNGTATVVRDAPFLTDMEVRGHVPRLATLVDIDEVFFHCSKALLRSEAWHPESWQPQAAARRAVIAQALERPGEALEALDEYYGAAYAEGLYRG